MKAGVIVFPGTNCDRDTLEACLEFGWEAQYIWHDTINSTSPLEHFSSDNLPRPLGETKRTAEGFEASEPVGAGTSEREEVQCKERALELRVRGQSRLGLPAQQQNENYLNNFDIIFLPGGFSYGDYLRSGALAKFSPVIEALKTYIEQKRGIVVGICNGFQILCEAGILPGALTHNEGLKFVCKEVELKIQNNKNKQIIRHAELVWLLLQKSIDFLQNVPMRAASIQHSTLERSRNEFGMTQDVINSRCTPHASHLTLPIAHAEGRYVADEKTIQQLKEKDMIFLTYVDNPNGSVEDIAGIYDRARQVIGMMPHPERAFFKETGNLDGKIVFEFIENEFKKLCP